MTIILLLSDTHGYIGPEILKHAEDCDEIWHAGDIGSVHVTDKLKAIKPLRAVYGNIDGAEVRNEFKEHCKFICEEMKVWITHIGGYPNRYAPKINKTINNEPPDLFIAGHSHILKVITDEKLNLLHMNPGAIGNHGFHKVRTMLKFEIQGKEVKNLLVIEYNR